jgi:hypothetical protein
MVNETTKPVYESRAVTDLGFLEIPTGEGWEFKVGEKGIVYLRKHISGPLNTDSEGWIYV